MYKILKLERLHNSVNGNPRYEVYFMDSDGENGEFNHATTKSDAAFCYGIENDIYSREQPQVEAALAFTRAGRISGFTVTKKNWSK